jgi:hypothetical protein
MRAWLILVTLLLTGCATSMQVAGPSARSLSPEDVEQLKQLAFDHGKQRYQAIKLVATARDRVRIETMQIYGDTTTDRDFYAARESGTWRIVKPPPFKPSKEPVIVSSPAFR